jgi:glucuronate isomerase
MLFTFALWDHEKGWVQQYHLGAISNNNDRLLTSLGPDTGLIRLAIFHKGNNYPNS